MGIGDWGLGIGDWGIGPMPNAPAPIPNPPNPNTQHINYIFNKFYKIIDLINQK